MPQPLELADDLRLRFTTGIARKRKSEFGQFMTPSNIARFMASLFPASEKNACRLLDAGAGLGALTCAFLDRWKAGELNFKTVDAFAYEIDDTLRGHLVAHLAQYKGIHTHIFSEDYISSSNQILFQGETNYTHAILNPPYKKINSQSNHRHELRALGIETVNLYSAFVALAVLQAALGGQIVAIIPRSFCNGPYYRPFREFILQKAAIHHIHVFNSRSLAFKDDEVLQENIIIRLERGGIQGSVTVSSSTDDTLMDFSSNNYCFDQIVHPDDSEGFIHIPTSSNEAHQDYPMLFQYSLADLGLSVSTGPVVDFRLKDYLLDMPGLGTVPLLYPMHFNQDKTVWPIEGAKKANAILRTPDTEKWLYPNGIYCVIRRFSSKEEKRRIIANVVHPNSLGDASALGFENHLNIFHENKKGLPESLAHGLAVFLNSSIVDQAFRSFNGHTQVNATDLRAMKYPSRPTLNELGQWRMNAGNITQTMIDEKVCNLTK